MAALATSTLSTPRIVFREPVSREGSIDAAWWPRSVDLSVELVPVLADLAAGGRRIARVIFDLGYWRSDSSRITAGGYLVKLGGFRTDDPHVVSLIQDQGRTRIEVLVIDPDTDPAVAERAMTLAASSGNLLRGQEIMQRAADLASASS